MKEFIASSMNCLLASNIFVQSIWISIQATCNIETFWLSRFSLADEQDLCCFLAVFSLLEIALSYQIAWIILSNEFCTPKSEFCRFSTSLNTIKNCSSQFQKIYKNIYFPSFWNLWEYESCWIPLIKDINYSCRA